jgi:hypothetical protein
MPWPLLSTDGFSDYSQVICSTTYRFVFLHYVCTRSPKVQAVRSIWLIFLSVDKMTAQTPARQSDNRRSNQL